MIYCVFKEYLTWTTYRYESVELFERSSCCTLLQNDLDPFEIGSQGRFRSVCALIDANKSGCI